MTIMPDPINWSLAIPYYAAALAGGYALGAIPVSFILAKITGHGDLRQIGSGNVGATNALRAGGKLIGAFALAGDFAKGFLAALIGNLWGPDIAIIAAAGAFFGHLFPIWLKFQGGKGVAVYIGIIAALYPPLALLFAAVWSAAAIISRYSSVASLAATLATPAAAAFWNQWQIAELTFFLALWTWAKHAGNIQRLMRGTEPKIQLKNPNAP